MWRSIARSGQSSCRMKPASTIALYSRCITSARREDVGLFGLVVVVLQIARDLAGRGRGHEEFFRLGCPSSPLSPASMSACAAGQSVQSTGPVQAGRYWNGEANGLSSSDKFGEFRSPVPSGGVLSPSKAGQAVEHMHGVVGAALFAVVDDVDAAFDLLAHHIGDRFAHGGLERGARAPGFLSARRASARRPSGGARQAAGVGGEDAVAAAFHDARIQKVPIRHARLR